VKLAERLTGHPADSEARRHVKCFTRDRDGVRHSTGTRIMVRRGGYWFRETATCALVPARLSDWEGKPPPGWEAAPRYGADPVNHPREPLGYSPPTVRMRHTHEGPYGPVEGTSPVDVRDVPARESQGWTLVS
jgi:hypothetical protein